jgi:hypothetical protein
MGNWTLYSPDYLNLCEVMDRPRTWKRGAARDYRKWSTGTLKIKNESADPSIISSSTVGVLNLDGFESDWRIFMDVPQLASLEAQPCHVVRNMAARSDRLKPAEGQFGNKEARVGVFFFGDGCMKIKIPSVHLGGKEHAGRWVTLYGVREAE